MKTKQLLVIVVMPVLAMSGGDYEISWSTIDGGGGRAATACYG